MNRETEMYHAAIKILSNRAEQYEYSDVLAHSKIKDAYYNHKKNKMLNKSQQERNKRSKGSDIDPGLQAEFGKHGRGNVYRNSDTVDPYANLSPDEMYKKVSKSQWDTDEENKVMAVVMDAIDHIDPNDLANYDFQFPDNATAKKEAYVRRRIEEYLDKNKFPHRTYMVRYATHINPLIQATIK